MAVAELVLSRLKPGQSPPRRVVQVLVDKVFSCVRVRRQDVALISGENHVLVGRVGVPGVLEIAHERAQLERRLPPIGRCEAVVGPPKAPLRVPSNGTVVAAIADQLGDPPARGNAERRRRSRSLPDGTAALSMITAAPRPDRKSVV